MKFNKKYKKLIKYYNKKLHKLNRQNMIDFSANMDYFVTYLQFMRDKFILTTDKNPDDDIRIISIVIAINEYQKYLTCITKYFKQNEQGILLPINDSIETLKKFNLEKNHHWDRFWEIIKDNIDLWEMNNVTI